MDVLRANDREAIVYVGGRWVVQEAFIASVDPMSNPGYPLALKLADTCVCVFGGKPCCCNNNMQQDKKCFVTSAP